MHRKQIIENGGWCLYELSKCIRQYCYSGSWATRRHYIKEEATVLRSTENKNVDQLEKVVKFLPTGRTADQCISLQCWAENRDFPRTAERTRRQATIKKRHEIYRRLKSTSDL